jgi:hypothetical protein
VTKQDGNVATNRKCITTITNRDCISTAILQPPFYNYQADEAVNYGGIGVIGHEISGLMIQDLDTMPVI